MSKKWTKISGISIASLGMLALVGCGQGANGTGANASNDTAGGSGNKPVQVTFWYGIGGNLSNDVQEMVQEFNKTHPNIHVTATYQGSYSGGGPEQQKLLAALKAGDPPTMAQIEVHSMPVFAATGKLVDLTDFMQNSSVDKPDNFLKGMLVSTQFNGKYYGVPLNRSVPVLYYNKTLFQKAGITAPPTTWAELQSDAKKLTQGSGDAKVYGFEPLVDWWPWEYSVWSGGGDILSSDLSKATFDSPSANHILSMEQALVKQGYATVESGPQYWDLMTQDFIHGRVAMDIDSIGSAGKVKAGVKNFDWGTAVLPKDATLAVPPGGGDMAIIQGASQDQIKAAETFIEWWTAPQQSAKWAEMTGYLPVQQAAVSDPSYQDYLKKNPQFKTALDELQYQHAAPASPNYLGVLQNVQQALQGIFDEGQPVDQTMKNAVNQANSALQ
jgi:sn-glycerol 3-phosphate transport system substrate-binding protein